MTTKQLSLTEAHAEDHSTVPDRGHPLYALSIRSHVRRFHIPLRPSTPLREVERLHGVDHA